MQVPAIEDLSKSLATAKVKILSAEERAAAAEEARAAFLQADRKAFIAAGNEIDEAAWQKAEDNRKAAYYAWRANQSPPAIRKYGRRTIGQLLKTSQQRINVDRNIRYWRQLMQKQVHCKGYFDKDGVLVQSPHCLFPSPQRPFTPAAFASSVLQNFAHNVGMERDKLAAADGNTEAHNYLVGQMVHCKSPSEFIRLMGPSLGRFACCVCHAEESAIHIPKLRVEGRAKKKVAREAAAATAASAFSRN